MISYYLSRHLQTRLAPLLFTDDDKPAAQAGPSPVAPAARSPRARAKAATKQTPAALPVHSFASLLATWARSASTRSSPPTPRCPASASSPLPRRPARDGDSLQRTIRDPIVAIRAYNAEYARRVTASFTAVSARRLSGSGL